VAQAQLRRKVTRGHHHHRVGTGTYTRDTPPRDHYRAVLHSEVGRIMITYHTTYTCDTPPTNRAASKCEGFFRAQNAAVLGFMDSSLHIYVHIWTRIATWAQAHGNGTKKKSKKKKHTPKILDLNPDRFPLPASSPGPTRRNPLSSLCGCVNPQPQANPIPTSGPPSQSETLATPHDQMTVR